MFFTAVWNGVQITRGSEYRGHPSRFDYSTFIILFLSSYLIVSKWWPITEWNKSYFFSARKFRQQLNSQDEVVIFSCRFSLPYTQFDFPQYIVNSLI